MIDVAALEARIEEEMARRRVPGFALAIVAGVEIAYIRGFGVTSAENPCVPVGPDTLFCCGSISKSLTAATVMRLADRGALDLDTPVSDYLPRLTLSEPSYSRGVTLRRLLSHSSGLFGTSGNFGSRDLATLETFVHDTVPRLPFVAPPGTAYEYSSIGIDLAGHVAEAVTGQFFPDIVREQLLAPLDMDRTTYDRTVAMTFDVALPHVTSNDGEPLVQHRMFDYAAANPAAQAMTSTRELAHFVMMAANEGRFRGRQVLPAARVAEMLRPHISLRDLDGTGYGLGFFTGQYSGRRWIAHGGMLTPYLCEICFLPDDGIGVVWQCNITNAFNPSSIRRLILDEYLGTREPAHSPAQPMPPRVERPLAPCAGTYFSLAAGFATISYETGHLVLERDGERCTLYPVDDGLFAGADRTVVVGVVPEHAGPPQYFMLDEHVYGRFDPASQVGVSSNLLQRYAGRYRFDDGDTVTVSLEHGTLHLTLSWMAGNHRCIPLGDNTFASGAGLVSFWPVSGKEVVLAWAGVVLAQRVDEGYTQAEDA